MSQTSEASMKEDEQDAGEPERDAGQLRAIEGGRAALERQALWAVALGKPDADALVRRLERPANANLFVVLAE